MSSLLCVIIISTGVNQTYLRYTNAQEHMKTRCKKALPSSETDNTRMWSSKTLTHCRWKCRVELWKMVWQFLSKLNVVLLCHPAVMHYGTCPKELKMFMQKPTHGDL